jgi:putative cardiolipin synthase
MNTAASRFHSQDLAVRGVRVLLRCAVALLAAWLAGCAGLPSQQDRAATYALEPSAEGRLGQAVLPLVRPHPGQTAVVAIDDGHVALAARLALARAATRSIDIQTFIWHPDAAGTLLWEEVLRAAERGVRVRLLLDDLNTAGTDPTLALLMSQPNVELRLYNPFVGRGSRALGFLGDFERLNHRMHNKSFTVDNVVAVVGGRNIADEYFETGADTGLVDLDAITMGQAVAQVSAEFDLFWNSDSAYPAKTILAAVEPRSRDSLAEKARAIGQDPVTARYADAVRRADVVEQLLAGTLRPEWTTARVVHDDPRKTLSPSSASEYQLLPRLEEAFGRPVSSLSLISPYFVPGEAGTDMLAGLVKRGVQVRILTNSLAATDEKSVHSGYVKYREALLQAGVQLFELKPEANPIMRRAGDVGRGSKAGLHAKTYAVDGRAIFIGSFNLDPRSSKLNTEMGLVIDSPALARRLASAVENAYPGLAYRVTLGDDGKLRWADGDGTLYETDPQTSWFDRTFVRIGSWLPIEWLL